MIGEQFGRLTVISFVGRDKYRNKFYLCKCKCGTEKIIFRSSLKTGATKSCGCLNKEIAFFAQMIKNIYAVGEHTQREIAETFDVSRPNISLIINDRRWA